LLAIAAHQPRRLEGRKFDQFLELVHIEASDGVVAVDVARGAALSIRVAWLIPPSARTMAKA
jgi:hypothetical protein